MAFPGRARNRVLFILLDIFAVFWSDVGRVTGLLLLQKYWDGGVGTPIFFYTVIFGLWVLLANYGGLVALF